MRLRTILAPWFLLILVGCSNPIVVEKPLLLVPPSELEPYCPELPPADLTLTEDLVDTWISDLGVYNVCKTGVEQYLLWIKNRKAAMEKENGSSR